MKKFILYTILIMSIFTTQCFAVDYVKIIDTAGQTRGVKMDSAGRIETALTGTTTIKPITYTQTSKTVTNAASTIVTASATGKYVYIENNDTLGIIYLNLSGTATASGSMITLNPEDSINLGLTTNAVSAIGSIASNANVVVVEGN